MDFIESWKEALILNPDGRDRFVWPIYCLANRLHFFVDRVTKDFGALLAEELPAMQRLRRALGNRSDYSGRLFATLPRIQAELDFTRALAGGHSIAQALEHARIGGLADDFVQQLPSSSDSARRGKPSNFNGLAAFVAHVCEDKQRDLCMV